MAPDLWLYFLAVLAVILLLGIATGGAIHVIVGATGMAALMVLFPQLFRIMLTVGTLYLLWVGWGIYRSADHAATTTQTEMLIVSGGTIYRRAVTTCLLNPKAYAFTFALFPAFVRSDTRSLLAQTLALCAITVGTQIAVYGAVAALALRSRAFIQARQSVMARAIGSMLMVCALLTATQAWATP